MTNFIRDKFGRVIGMLDVGGPQPEGNQTLRTPTGSVLGWYEANSNVTRDKYGRYVGQGNIVMSLLNLESK